MPFGIAAGVAALGAAYMQHDAAKDAASAAQKGASASLNEQRAARQWMEQNSAPFIQAGQGALGTINSLNAGDFSSFQRSPDFQFRLQQGFQGLNRDAAARGRLNAGGTDADRIAFGQGLASQAYGDYYNRLSNLAAMGQNAVSQQGSAMQNTANQMGNIFTGNAAAQGNAAMQSANAWGNALGGLGNLAGQYYGGRQSSYAGNPNYLAPIQRETFRPDTSLNLGGYGG